jgi:hypothetical protein
VIDQVLRYIVPCAYSVLPKAMASPKATVMLLAIGLQESRFLDRRQGGDGPGRGFWQFERGGGIKGVMTHPKTNGPLATALTELRYASVIGDAVKLHAIVEHNDVVACVFARLLLWTVAGPLPSRDEPGKAWAQYIDGWRPGKPHRETWTNYYVEAWARVDQSPVNGDSHEP